MEQGFVIETGKNRTARRRIDVDAVLLQCEDVANFTKHVEKNVAVTHFRRGHFVIGLRSMNCHPNL
jgi:hypothetical protein